MVNITFVGPYDALVGLYHSEFLILNSELNLRWGLIIKSWKNLAKIRRSCGQYVAKI